MPKPSDLKELRSRASDVATLLKILSHPNRLLIACQLMEGEHSVGDIESMTGVAQPVLSRDLARLRVAGLVATRRDSKQVFYRLADRRLAAVVEGLCIACADEPAFRKRNRVRPNGPLARISGRRSL